MSGAVVAVTSDMHVSLALSAADQLRDIADRITAANAQEAKLLHDRLSVAREWAKLQQDSERLLEDLRFIEARVLARIAALGAERDVLSPPYRSAARHFATLDDADLAKFLNDNRSSTALGSYKRYSQQKETDRIIKSGRETVVNRLMHKRFADLDHHDERQMREAARRLTTMRSAVALIVDEYTSEVLPFTTAEVVEEFIRDNPPDGEAPTWQEQAFRKGLQDAVRQALVQAPVETTDRSDWIPRFITVYEPDADLWTRIPSEFATIRDVRSMISARRGQIEAMTRACDQLSEQIHADAKDDDWFRYDVTALDRRARESEPGRMGRQL